MSGRAVHRTDSGSCARGGMGVEDDNQKEAPRTAADCLGWQANSQRSGEEVGMRFKWTRQS